MFLGSAVFNVSNSSTGTEGTMAPMPGWDTGFGVGRPTLGVRVLRVKTIERSRSQDDSAAHTQYSQGRQCGRASHFKLFLRETCGRPDMNNDLLGEDSM
jgi:hypothetical protein